MRGNTHMETVISLAHIFLDQEGGFVASSYSQVVGISGRLLNWSWLPFSESKPLCLHLDCMALAPPPQNLRVQVCSLRQIRLIWCLLPWSRKRNGEPWILKFPNHIFFWRNEESMKTCFGCLWNFSHSWPPYNLLI